MPKHYSSEDFPGSYRVNEKTGRMQTDVDGRPIHPDAVIVGRAYENRPDVPLSDADANRMIRQLTGKGVAYAVSENNPHSLGRYKVGRSDRGFGTIEINPPMPDELKKRTKRHEMAHLLDHVGGKHNDTVDDLPKDIAEELYSLYNEQRNPYSGFERLRGPFAEPRDVEGGDNWFPSRDGYKPADEGELDNNGNVADQTRAELFAEAMRACLTNPNALKSKYPHTAKY